LDTSDQVNESNEPAIESGGSDVEREYPVTRSTYPVVTQRGVQSGDPNDFVGAGDPASMFGMGEPMLSNMGGFQIPDYVDYDKMDEYDKVVSFA
jgi:hypothetical protein